MTKTSKLLKLLITIAGISGCFLIDSAASQVKTENNPERMAAIAPLPVSHNITIDQFGYRPQDPKVAIIADPQVGFDRQKSFVPGKQYAVVEAKTKRKVFIASPVVWNQGEIDTLSGNKGWWFDFSGVRRSGTYYILDLSNNNRSYTFEIGEDVYKNILKTAFRMFFYQRANFDKQPPYADRRWAEKASFVGSKQDREALSIVDNSHPRDVTGGWHDAGDKNKYVTFYNSAIHQLLTTYTDNPQIWTDDFNLPESGNGIPDLIDEIKIGLDWIVKMQDSDGGVYNKVGKRDKQHKKGLPSQDPSPRFYTPKCSSSTINAAGMFAHAALVYGKIPSFRNYAAELERRAELAWEWYISNPRNADCEKKGWMESGDSDRSLSQQDSEAVVAAIYLYNLTGKEKYHQPIRQSYYQLGSIARNDCMWAEQNDALMIYATLTKGDDKIKQQIRDHFQYLTENSSLYGFNREKSLYRAYIAPNEVTWGSNRNIANCGNNNYNLVVYGLDRANESIYRTRALGILNYLHGVNPFAKVYLTNMYEYGVENSANKTWMEWFSPGSVYDDALKSPIGPAPGYVVGGPNISYQGRLSSVTAQPPFKAWFESNRDEDKAWEITEPQL